MNTFLKTYRLALTPLSPIHIGCGEDFEPTNYVIDDGVLYGFDPSRATLNELQKSKLTAAANNASLLGIQRFFKANAKDFMVHADVLIPVSSGVADKYESAIGRVANTEANGNQIVNNLAVERASYTGKLRQPYIPGSSFKGAIRTAVLDELNAGHRPFEDCKKSSERLEKRLFGGGEFQTSPMRLVKVADLMPAAGSEPARCVMYAVNLKKAKVLDKDGNERQPKGIAARKECILHGQFRAFVADAVLPSLDPHRDSKTTPGPELRPTDFKALAQQSNAYNLTRMRREMVVLNGRGFVNPDWKKSVEALIGGELKTKFDSGTAFLIRLGRYGGAESKTLSGDGVANIKIMGARVDGKQQSTFESTTKTVWLAAERENEQKCLLPFGWAIVEIDPKEGDSPQLKAWCEAQSKGRRDMAALRQQFEYQRGVALQQKVEQSALAAHWLELKKADEFAKQQRVQQLASLSEQGRLVEDLRQRCNDWASKLPPNGNFKRQDANIAKAGLFQDAHKLATQALTNAQWQTADQETLADMLEQCLPKVVAPWGPDEKKKLKLTALRGQAA